MFLLNLCNNLCNLLSVFCYSCWCCLLKLLLTVHLVGCEIKCEGVHSPFSLQSLQVPRSALKSAQTSRPTALKYGLLAYYAGASFEPSSNFSRYDCVLFGKRSEAPHELAHMYKSTRQFGVGSEVRRIGPLDGKDVFQGTFGFFQGMLGFSQGRFGFFQGMFPGEDIIFGYMV